MHYDLVKAYWTVKVTLQCVSKIKYIHAANFYFILVLLFSSLS
jgi:hypothetical protein